MRRALAFAALGLLTNSAAHGACTKPDAPFCAVRPGPFTGVADFDQCRMQMIAYRDGIEVFATCVKQEKPGSPDEQAARDEYEKVWSQFNRRARETPG